MREKTHVRKICILCLITFLFHKIYQVDLYILYKNTGSEPLSLFGFFFSKECVSRSCNQGLCVTLDTCNMEACACDWIDAGLQCNVQVITFVSSWLYRSCQPITSATPASIYRTRQHRATSTTNVVPPGNLIPVHFPTIRCYLEFCPALISL